MTRLRTIPEMLGCGDHGCVFEKPTGMGTNGGCRCLMDVRDPSVRVPLRRKIVAQRETIREQRAEIERLRAAIGCGHPNLRRTDITGTDVHGDGQ